MRVRVWSIVLICVSSGWAETTLRLTGRLSSVRLIAIANQAVLPNASLR